MTPMILTTLTRTLLSHSELPSTLLFTLEEPMELMVPNSITPLLTKTLIPCPGKVILMNSSILEMYTIRYAGNFSFKSRRFRCHVLLHPWSRPFCPLLRYIGSISQAIRISFRLWLERTWFQQEISGWLWLLYWNIKLLSNWSPQGIDAKISWKECNCSRPFFGWIYCLQNSWYFNQCVKTGAYSWLHNNWCCWRNCNWGPSLHEPDHCWQT